MTDDEALYREIGQRLKAARTTRKMSQTKLADLLGIKRTSVTNAEGGRQRFPVHTLYRIAAILNCDPHELLPNTTDRLIPTSRVEWL